MEAIRSPGQFAPLNGVDGKAECTGNINAMISSFKCTCDVTSLSLYKLPFWTPPSINPGPYKMAI